MPLFTSKREKRLWIIAIAIVIAIYSTIGLTGRLAEMLRAAGLINYAFVLGMIMVLATIATQGLKTRPGGAEISVTMGLAAAYFLVFVRMTMLEERSHLIEYSLLGFFIYQALLERRKNRDKLPFPAVLAWLATVILGWVDEGLQAFIPHRVYDIEDVLFNSLAAFLAIAGSACIGYLKNRRG